MSRKILILGGNTFFINIIKIAKKLNLKVISIDKNKNSIAKKYADEFYNIDFSNHRSVLELAKKKKIDGIITHQSDAGVYSVGYVNSKLKLKGPSFNISKICSDKSKMRQHLDGFIDQPKFITIKKGKNIFSKIRNFGYPCNIKPSKGSGSRGIYIVRSDKDLKRFKNEYELFKESKLVLESFIEGLEFGSQVLIINGKIKKIFIHNDIFLNRKTPVPIGHSFPSKLSKNKIEELENYIEKIVDRLKIDNAALNLDFILPIATA